MRNPAIGRLQNNQTAFFSVLSHTLMKLPRPTALYFLAPALLLTHCNVGPDYKKPNVPTPGKFSGTKEGIYSKANADASIRNWWRRFNDAELNSLINRAIAHNQDLRIAAANVEQARALYRQARLDYFPTVRSQGYYQRTHYSDAQSLGAIAGATGASKNLQVLDAELDATWELDFWGRVRRSVRAANADVATAEANRRDALVILTAQLASAYMQLRGLQMELGVAQRNAANQRETLKLTESLLQGGRGTELDTSRARAQLNQTLAAIPSIESAISKNTHLIGVLTGYTPESVEKELAATKPLPDMPSLVRIGDPASLLRRRPDIEAAEESLRAATERIGVATADLFPRVVFNGTAGVQANNFAKFGGPNIGATSFGPNISWPAFDLGRVKAQIDAAGAKAKSALASYEKVVNGALQETEDALVDYGRQRARTGFLREAASASEQAAKLARERYQNGVADFLTVLDAERTMLQAQSDLAASETVTATAIVAIFRALDGGWDSSGSEKVGGSGK